MKKEYKPPVIKHIVAAPPGWIAEFSEDDKIVGYPVAVWCVMTDEDGDRVVGMSEGQGYMDEDCSASNFIGYKKV